jgi:hypothetical protein
MSDPWLGVPGGGCNPGGGAINASESSSAHLYGDGDKPLTSESSSAHLYGDGDKPLTSAVIAGERGRIASGGNNSGKYLGAASSDGGPMEAAGKKISAELLCFGASSLFLTNGSIWTTPSSGDQWSFTGPQRSPGLVRPLFRTLETGRVVSMPMAVSRVSATPEGVNGPSSDCGVAFIS